MKYKEEVRKLYPTACLFHDIRDYSEVILYNNDLKYIIVISDNYATITEEYDRETFLKKYPTVGYWCGSPKLAWKNAYDEIEYKFIKSLSL